jgi:Domain of unknown function (DUF3291)
MPVTHKPPKTYHLAQVNIGRIRAPIDDPLMAGFVAKLDEINALADGTPGFVWRLQTDEGNATALRPFDEDFLLMNMSVWETPEQLREYVYRSDHAGVMRQRKQWFEKYDGPYMALWWIPAGHIPTTEEAKQRLEHLRTHGETAHAFSFAKLFPPPDAPDAAPQVGFAEPCPAL